jgi:hypothetical protein
MSERTKEREALEEGLVTEFWKLFAEHVTREWGPAGLRYQSAVIAASQSANAVVELQKVLHTQEQIALLLRWPAERMNALKDTPRPSEQSMSRRGPGL